MSRKAGKEPSQRQRRVGESIRQAVSELLRREDFHGSPLSAASITITEVHCSPDLRHATVYVLPLGKPTAQVLPLVEALNAQASQFRRYIGNSLRLKYTPHLVFRADNTFDYASQIHTLLSGERVRRDVEAASEITDAATNGADSA